MESDPSRPNDPFVGTVIDGRYQVTAQLGAGGMGVVYRAHQIRAGRDVAIKVLSAGMTNKDLLKRFENEARAIASLRSPHTLKLIDFGKTGTGQLFIVTELLVGKPLNEMLASGALGLERSLKYIQQVCASLEEAHGQGIVHRDLKPGNIFVEFIGDQEHVKVLDFGIAKLAEQPGLTNSGALLGTPHYMSPEQAESGTVGAQSDLYSLGVVLFRCMKGKLPFTGGNAASVLLKHLRTEAPPLNSGWATLDALLSRMLAKTPEKRPQSALALRRELEQLSKELLLRGASVAEQPADPVSVSSELASPLGQTLSQTSPVSAPRRRSGGLAVLGLALLGIAGAVVVGLRGFQTEYELQAQPQPQPLPKTQTNAPPKVEVVTPQPSTVEPPPPEKPIALKPPPAKVTPPVKRPPPVAPAKGNLRVMVKTSSGRSVQSAFLLNGQPLGEHSSLSRQVSPGVYTLEIRPLGYPVQRRRIRVRGGRSTTIRLTAD